MTLVNPNMRQDRRWLKRDQSLVFSVRYYDKVPKMVCKVFVFKKVLILLIFLKKSCHPKSKYRTSHVKKSFLKNLGVEETIPSNLILAVSCAVPKM
jgi:hypothetical protein